MKKVYKLIISGEKSFSLSNETDCDSQSDYFPGIWSINTQKSALYFAKKYIDEGDEVYVTDYDNAKHHALANKFIKELGIKQPLFPEPDMTIKSSVTNGKPSTLGALRKYLSVGTKVRIESSQFPDRNRDTEIVLNNTTSCATKKGDGKSWIYWNKATDWGFDNEGATSYYFQDGKMSPSFKIIYQ